jgi:hypothetical protein
LLANDESPSNPGFNCTIWVVLSGGDTSIEPGEGKPISFRCSAFAAEVRWLRLISMR